MTRKGYKHTELGEIPEDWEVKTLGNLCKIVTGDLDVNEMDINGKYPFYTCDEKPYRINEYAFDTEAILVSGNGSHVGYVNLCSGKFNVYQRTYVLDQFQVVIQLFLYHYMRYNFKHYLLHNLRNSSIPFITLPVLSSFKLPLPPLPEQRAIASALSDVDAIIEALDRLIDKKRKIKQGTMQQLLSGKKRLKGFGKGKGYKHTELGETPEDWEVKTLGEIGCFKSGNGFPIIYQGNDNGMYPFYKVSDLNTNQSDCMNISKNYISDEVAEILKVNLIQSGSIVFAKIGAAVYLERKKILTKTSCIDNNMMAFTLYDTCYNKYIYHWMLSFRISTLSNTSALPSISASDLQGVKLPLPPLPEQRAIASVLSDMDAEIEALEAKRNKYTIIKQGMMQDLLTGRVRLPKKEV